MKKLKLFLASSVFREIGENPMVSGETRGRIRELWGELNEACEVVEFAGRFPSKAEIERAVLGGGADLVGCHLSHPIPADLLEESGVLAVSTSTAGFNHVGVVPNDDVLITHTPGVLHETVADFTVAVILANLRNLVDHHEFVWSGKWSASEKWDLDQKLVTTIDSLKVGVVGMGEIGTEVTRKLSPWGIHILYHDPNRREDVEREFPNVTYSQDMGGVFEQCDVVSLHVPLVPATEGLVGTDLLSRMKRGSLLVNTSRGGVVNFPELLDALESGRAEVNLAFDVYDPEPISAEVLRRFKGIKEANPHLRFTFVPHNASADADTRGKMACILFEDLATIAKARSFDELATCRLIPRHRRALESGDTGRFRINSRFA
ncbi:MAG: 2-hydroxyacid dehydrogenase [Promethearchaeota archaeon]